MQGLGGSEAGKKPGTQESSGLNEKHHIMEFGRSPILMHDLFKWRSESFGKKQITHGSAIQRTSNRAYLASCRDLYPSSKAHHGSSTIVQSQHSMGNSGSENGGTVPYKAIFCGDITPYIGLKNRPYIWSVPPINRFLKWPLIYPLIIHHLSILVGYTPIIIH